MNPTFYDIGHGKPVVLIHGFPLSKEMWKQQVKSLTDNNFRVILPDLPGFGENYPAKRFYSIEEMAAQIVELLEKLEIKKAIIGGLSMGGYLVFEMFRRAPDKFSALILADTTHLADTLEKRNSRFELISKIEKQGSKALTENMLPNLISEYTKLNKPDLTAELEEIFSKVNPVSAINALQAMAERNDSSDLLEKISIPTMLVFGEFDKVTNLENANIMRDLISSSKLNIVEKAGHYSNLEQPARFNEILIDFCNLVDI